jgi:hypothetical protein
LEVRKFEEFKSSRVEEFSSGRLQCPVVEKEWGEDGKGGVPKWNEGEAGQNTAVF